VVVVQSDRACTAFEGFRCIATGTVEEVAPAIREVLVRGEQAPVLIFDDATSELVELDLRGSIRDVKRRLAQLPQSGDAGAGTAESTNAGASTADAPRSAGRPKLGVVGREVTLLPRHWEWLNQQPGGASVALRKLVEEARRANEHRDRARQAQEAAYRFMSALAGNLPDFEEATRALFASDFDRVETLVRKWPKDVRAHLVRLLDRCRQTSVDV
jgi:uncharacterized protein